MTKGSTFRLSQLTRGYKNVDSAKLAIEIPRYSVIEVLTGEENQERMVEVEWEGTRVMLFAVDVQDRGIPMKPSHRKG